jgi:signal transduction histidine kinase
LPFNARPPPVVVEGVWIDDKSVSPKTTAVKVPPGSRRLEFRYAGLSFAAPDRVRFQYRLHGFDEDWVKANNRFAHYTKVPPGEYRFQVIAANNDNVWNNTGASLAVVVEPYFWQTGWFRILSACTLIGGAGGLVRYLSLMRLRRRVAELERRQALENERGRIARDLHDHLGADLSQLALWSELATQEKDRPENMADRVRSVSSLAREVIQNVDEIVWTMNPKNDSLDRFAAYVCEFSERLVTHAGLRFRWEAPDKIPAAPLLSDVRHHVFLVTKEALNNVVKHAGATEARVELAHAHHEFVLTISDNGRGFKMSAASPTSTGNGLANMHQRIIQCGGRLAIHSDNGGGTVIRIRVPLSAPA